MTVSYAQGYPPGVQPPNADPSQERRPKDRSPDADPSQGISPRGNLPESPPSNSSSCFGSSLSFITCLLCSCCYGLTLIFGDKDNETGPSNIGDAEYEPPCTAPTPPPGLPRSESAD